MYIIVEGAKYTGKTTLCKKFAEKYRCDVVHCPGNCGDAAYYFSLLAMGVVPPEKENEYQEKILVEIEKKFMELYDTDYVVFDRSFISNFIYRNGNLDTEHILNTYKSFLKRSVVVILVARDDTLVERIKKREDKILVAFEWDKLFISNAKFRQFIQESGAKKIVCENDIRGYGLYWMETD